MDLLALKILNTPRNYVASETFVKMALKLNA